MNKYNCSLCYDLDNIIAHGMVYIDQAVKEILLKHNYDFQLELLKNKADSTVLKHLDIELAALELPPIKKDDRQILNTIGPIS